MEGLIEKLERCAKVVATVFGVGWMLWNTMMLGSVHKMKVFEVSNALVDDW